MALAFVPNLQDATGFSTFYLVYAYFLFFWIAQSTSWNILSGYTGYFSFGQGAFYGLGVYTAGDLVTREGVNYFLTIPIAGLLGGAPGGRCRRARVPPRLAARRDLRAADARRHVHARRRSPRSATWVDGGQGIAIPIPELPGRSSATSRTSSTGSGSRVAALAVVAAFLIQNSRFGWGLFSIRDEEDVAEELGVPTFRYKMFAITDLRRPRRPLGRGRGAADRLPHARRACSTSRCRCS